MNLHFTGGLPVLGYCEVDGQQLAFAWGWHEPVLRVTFTERTPDLLGHVTHLDGLPRLATAPANHAWLTQDDPARSMAVLDHAINLWRTKESIFRTCNG